MSRRLPRTALADRHALEIRSASAGYRTIMGQLARWDARNQRTADWQNEVGRRNPNPRVGRSVGITLAGMVADHDLIAQRTSVLDG
jgi:hypothetical protein